MLTAFAGGVIFSALSSIKSKSSKSFAVATAVLPMAVAVVIALVNGNIGVGVAIAGAFGLVRFRSAQGTAREIAVIFLAMAGGLAFGMGYIAYGFIILLVSGLLLLASALILSRESVAGCEKELKITIPESLDYTGVFDDIFAEYTSRCELERVKSTNMGSMFCLTYSIKLKNPDCEKLLIDAVRTRNGNLEIICSKAGLTNNEL